MSRFHINILIEDIDNSGRRYMIFFSNRRESIIKPFTIFEDNENGSIRNSLFTRRKRVRFNKCFTTINTFKSSASVINDRFIHIKERMRYFSKFIIFDMRMKTTAYRTDFNFLSKSNRNNDQIIFSSNR